MAFYGNGSNITNLPSASSLSTASGSAPSYSARAFLVYDQVNNSITNQRNISSVTDNSTGLFTVNFSTSMPYSNHTPVTACSHSGFGGMECAPNRNGSGLVGGSTSNCVFSSVQANTGNRDSTNYIAFFA